MRGLQLNGEHLNPGDRVQQIGLYGLAPLNGERYVVEAHGGEVVLSQAPDGPPITDLHGAPRHYPEHIFRKVTWQ